MRSLLMKQHGPWLKLSKKDRHNGAVFSSNEIKRAPTCEAPRSPRNVEDVGGCSQEAKKG